ncbi:hypothetical protein NQ152_14925 [Microbacterium sp. zg.B48]|uniref:hypothetical protein n=1 Tax=unclassified Microbacterium TaxID=2609290 RepID=UPI00214B8626|nr:MULTISPECIES: hypothetical protein [unclassified Microbacterium]MCR2764804.1 hypothetical protein [Microbacterium sp. zg.B48]MCR2810058.1 hypothetical protein [Microbacterium sp. zg.B185]WIM20102.1 hypothetical protein QNO12_04655 [Microbacterium sp. zg-B185]
MVFDPTFHEIDREAANLPDLAGADVDIDPADLDHGVDAADAGSVEEEQEAAAEGSAEADIVLSDVPADDLPPYGQE